jgi:hypothetical protein
MSRRAVTKRDWVLSPDCLGFGALPYSRLRSGWLVITVAGNTLIVHIVTSIMARTPGVAGVIAVDSYAIVTRELYEYVVLYTLMLGRRYHHRSQ